MSVSLKYVQITKKSLESVRIKGVSTLRRKKAQGFVTKIWRHHSRPILQLQGAHGSCERQRAQYLSPTWRYQNQHPTSHMPPAVDRNTWKTYFRLGKWVQGTMHQWFQQQICLFCKQIKSRCQLWKLSLSFNNCTGLLPLRLSAEPSLALHKPCCLLWLHGTTTTAEQTKLEMQTPSLAPPSLLLVLKQGTKPYTLLHLPSYSQVKVSNGFFFQLQNFCSGRK